MLQHLATFEADLLHSASQPYHTPYIIPINIYQLTMSNHVSYSILLSLALEWVKICSISDQYPTPIFSGWVFLWKNRKSFHLQLMLSCSVVALISSLLGLVGLAGLGHHYYHHSHHGIFQWDEVKDWSHDHRHGHSMEAMKQILWWG